MLARCYSNETLKDNPTYRGCTVCSEWLRFTTFKKWMEKQKWEGMQLDKDILIQGNKVYSPKACLFIPLKINIIFKTKPKSSNSLPQGVSKLNGKFRCWHNKKHLGMFNTADLAFEAYKSSKYSLIKEIALKQSEPLRSAMLCWVIK